MKRRKVRAVVFSQSVPYYDKLSSSKDYSGEVERLTTFIREGLRSGGKRLLDVACGTGRHLEYFRESFEVEGMDVSAEFLEFSRQRNPGVPFHQADMLDFNLGQKFDVVTCLFSSIGYVKTLENAARAVRSMARHLSPGGLLIVEPWFTPGAWQAGTVHALFIDEPELKIARINTSFVEGRLSYFDLHYLIGTPEKTVHFVEHHELGLFETDEMLRIFEEAGLQVTYDPEGLIGRGLFLGLRPK